jgi:hypothetical protein
MFSFRQIRILKLTFWNITKLTLNLPNWKTEEQLDAHTGA